MESVCINSYYGWWRGRKRKGRNIIYFKNLFISLPSLPTLNWLFFTIPKSPSRLSTHHRDFVFWGFTQNWQLWNIFFFVHSYALWLLSWARNGDDVKITSHEVAAGSKKDRGKVVTDFCLLFVVGLYNELVAFQLRLNQLSSSKF